MNDSENTIVLDKIDHKIIQSLLEDGRASFSKIAREVKLTDVAIKKRVDRLRMKGIITSFSVDLNLKSLGYENPVFVQLRSDLSQNKEVVKRINQLDFVIELYHVMGEYNLLAKVITPNMDSMNNFLSELEKIDGVKDIKTLVVVEQRKKSNVLPAHSLQKKL